MSRAARLSATLFKVSRIDSLQATSGGSVLPKSCFEKPLHGVKLALRGARCERAQASGQDVVGILDVWREDAEPKLIADPIWLKEDKGERFASLLRLSKTPRGLSLEIDCEGKGHFEYTPEGLGVYWAEGGTGPAHYLQSLGLSLWLEQRGLPCIHANALAVDGFAIGLIAPSQEGKTTLSAALLEQGMQLMTDDMLALYPDEDSWTVYPGWPQLRMWPDSVQRYVAANKQVLAKVHHRFDKRIVGVESIGALSFCTGSRPLNQLFLLERRQGAKAGRGEVRIETISPSEAMIHLLQNSILGDAYKALRIESSRLKALARLVRQVPFKKLSYPSGEESLPWVCEEIKRDLAQLRKC